MRKYKNIRTQIGEHWFDSKKEALRYTELCLLQKTKFIKNLELQPKFELICNGVKVGTYIADFRYFDCKLNKVVVEDVKSPITKTPVYNLKKRILLTLKPKVEITEIF